MSSRSSGTTVRTKKVSAKKNKLQLDHVSICLCTYRRPHLLNKLLKRLRKQKTGGEFKYSVVVVDNDTNRSAQEVVSHHSKDSKVGIEYYHQPIKGLTYARNKSLAHSKGKYIAFIDDDELPEIDWLYQLFTTIEEYNADAVFGSVIPVFEVQPPQWVTDRKFFYWRDMRQENGTKTDKHVTNNALVRRDLILKYNLKFDHDFAFAGGEDQAFFFELLDYKPDAKLLNCKDAVVHEHITTDRCDPLYIQKRNILEGKGRVFGVHKFYESYWKRKYVLVNRFFQSYFRILLIWSALPVLLFFKKDLGTEYYYRNYYHIGILLAICDFSPYKDRKSIGLQ